MAAAAQRFDPVGGLHPDVQAAVVLFSERQAGFAVALLHTLVTEAGRRGDSMDVQGLPLGFLMELGAIMQLQMWERSGVRPLLPTELPTVAVAAGELNARVQADPTEFARAESAVLSRRLLNVWMEHFSWTAPVALGVDIVIGRVDEDALVETVAQLLWNYRRADYGVN